MSDGVQVLTSVFPCPAQAPGISTNGDAIVLSCVMRDGHRGSHRTFDGAEFRFHHRGLPVDADRLANEWKLWTDDLDAVEDLASVVRWLNEHGYRVLTVDAVGALFVAEGEELRG